MILDMLISAFGQGFIYAPMALGVFISFGILKTPDLSVEGSFVFGMTVCAQTAILGHPVAGLFAGMFAGALAGACTGLLQTKLKIEAILSGILTMTGLYTVNYAMLGGQSNRYLPHHLQTVSVRTGRKPGFLPLGMSPDRDHRGADGGSPDPVLKDKARNGDHRHR